MIAALIVLALAPRFSGDPEAAPRLEEPLRAAVEATRDFGPWPEAPWEVRLHPDAASFERATKAPPGRAAQWSGAVLHLRPWDELRRRDLGAVLRHECVHRRLQGAGLRRWEEEARCILAETRLHPPASWPAPPARALQDRLDLALASGTTASQKWAYGALRAWLGARPLPAPPSPPRRPGEPSWRKEALAEEKVQVVVRWPAERLPRTLAVDGRPLDRVPHALRSTAALGPGVPRLAGRVELRPVAGGWTLAWRTDALTWIAAATAGELGEDAPPEARRALAAVLRAWLAAHPSGNHPDGSLCPLTHCAVVRGTPSAATLDLAAAAPVAPAGAVWFCASKGGVSLSPLQVWGRGPGSAPPAPGVPGDPWAAWTRTLTAAQVRLLKREVPPGLRPGQAGMRLGPSGPYPVEDLRLAAGRAFGWTAWPSNACEGEILPDGSLRLAGHGLGHNVGLCLAAARDQAGRGMKAEEILRSAF